MFTFECPKCGLLAEVQEKDSGRQIKCPQCDTHLEIPEPEPGAVPEAAPPEPDNIQPPVEPKVIDQSK